MQSAAPPAVAHGAVLERDPWLPHDIVEHLRHRVARFPEGRLISCGPTDERSQSYAALWERSAAIASGLRWHGAEAGRPVVLLLQDVLDFVPAFWACLRAGVMAVPLTSVAADPLLERRAAGLDAALSRLDRPLILADAVHAPVVSALRERGFESLSLAEAELGAPRVAPSEATPFTRTVCLVPTSGSTGRVKLAAFGHDTLLHRPMMNPSTGPVEEGASLCPFPFDGITGLRIVFLLTRIQLHLPFQAFAARPTRLLDVLQSHRVVELLLTSSMADRLTIEAEAAPTDWDLSPLGSVHFGAEPVMPAVMRRFRALLARHGAVAVRCRAGYGATETGPLVVGADIAALAPDAEASPLGPCMRGVTLRIVDEAGQIVPEGVVGTVEAHCPQVIFSGYWGDEAATRSAFTPDGWWKTGDRGRLEGGILTLLGRIKDVVVIHGRKHSLVDIDILLSATLGIVGQAYACAVPGAGEKPESLAVVLVPPVTAETEAVEAAAELVHRVVARRFGLTPAIILAVRAEDLPLTGAGKIRRFALGERVREGHFGRPLRGGGVPLAQERRTPLPPSASTDGTLAAIWREVLGLRDPLDPNGHFFELGGDSLRALTLATRIAETFGHWIGAEAFFAEPTLATLARLVGAPPPNAVSPAEALAWPLPDDLRAKQMSLFVRWSGTRPTRDRLIAGLNTGGSEPPLFWVFQEDYEFRRLAEQLGPERPLYGLRSGSQIIAYAEDEIQALALRYVHEITEVRPEGPIFLGGNCQGAIIALAVAQHLLRRGRDIPLLVLMEWSFPLQPYGGRVLLVYGRDSLQGNPYRRYRDPEQVWRRTFPDHRSAEIPGGHGTFFDEGAQVETLGRVLRAHLAAALDLPPPLPTRDAFRARLSVRETPEAMPGGGTGAVVIDVVNAGRFAWEAEPFGLALRVTWYDPSDAMIVIQPERPALPALKPGEGAAVRVPVTVPDHEGVLTLVIDLIDAAGTWRLLARREVLRIPIRATRP